MKITYNPQLDTLHILFRSAPISETSRQSSDVTLDYDQHGRLVGMELATASEYVANPYDVSLIAEDALATEGTR